MSDEGTSLGVAAGHPETGRRGVLLAIYNIVYWPYFVLSMPLLFVPALLIFVFTFAFDKRRSLLQRYTSWWGAHYLAWAPLAGVDVIGRERAPKGPCVYVANHQSMVDILAAFATRLPYVWVSKVENFYAPFLGWNMALNRY